MCAGIVTVAKPLSIECQMANYSNSLYEQLEEETGVRTGQPRACARIAVGVFTFKLISLIKNKD